MAKKSPVPSGGKRTLPHSPRNLETRETGQKVRACGVAAGAENLGNWSKSESGTEFAYYSFPPTQAERRHEDWGGARNRRDRVSDALSLAQATNIHCASLHAICICLPFTRHISIHWELAGVRDNEAADATSRFLKLVRDWLRKRGAGFSCAWVRENGYGKGSHVHILLHVPVGVSLSGMTRRWLRRVTGLAYRARTIRTTRIGRTANSSTIAPAAYETNLANVVGYILKGVSCADAAKLGLHRHQPGGRIIGKRAGCSENIGPGRRRSYKFVAGLADDV